MKITLQLRAVLSDGGCVRQPPDGVSGTSLLSLLWLLETALGTVSQEAAEC